MARITKGPSNIIKYKVDDDPTTRYVELPKVIKEDYSFQMMFGFTYPSVSYNSNTGIKSQPFNGTIKDSYFKIS